MLETHLLDYEGWTTRVSNTGFVLTPEVATTCRDLVEAACRTATREPTAVWDRYDQPSLLARVDCTLLGPEGEGITLAEPTGPVFDLTAGTVSPSEVEMRPAAIGISARLSTKFTARLAVVRQNWPALRATVSTNRSAHDDAAWLGPEHATYGPHVPDDGSLVIVRAEPDETAYHPLASRSASLLHAKGNRSYGEKLGWWRWISSPSELPSSGAFVLKRRASSKTRDILICRPSDKGSKPGMLSRSKTIERFTAIAAIEGGMYLQPYYPPMRFDRQFMILRIVFAFDLPTQTWVCLGGVWNLLGNVIVHGTERAIFGPLVLG